MSIILDTTDLEILRLLVKEKSGMVKLSKEIGLTYPNFLTHINRLKPYLGRVRVKQTHYLSLNKKGKRVVELFYGG